MVLKVVTGFAVKLKMNGCLRLVINEYLLMVFVTTGHTYS